MYLVRLWFENVLKMLVEQDVESVVLEDGDEGEMIRSMVLDDKHGAEDSRIHDCIDSIADTAAVDIFHEPADGHGNYCSAVDACEDSEVDYKDHVVVFLSREMPEMILVGLPVDEDSSYRLEERLFPKTAQPCFGPC
jgi:hypothetical protein